jgi:predicted aldo/keto reductase-like oxidoreductase
MEAVNRVPTRRFGRTELTMPVFSCGGMRYQQSWKDLEGDAIEAANQANLEATIERALACGINHIETARGYGTSELQLGRILPRVPRDQLIVQTKIGPRETAAEFLEAFERSLDKLQLEYVDLLAVHGLNAIELVEQSLRPGGMIEAVQQLRAEGRVRHYGFSTHGPVDAIVRAIESDAFDYLNLHWYYVNQTTWPAIEAARRHDMGVFIISPNDKGGKLYEPSDKLRALCAPLTPMQFNDLFCLRHDDVHTLSLGAARPSDFDEHVEAMAYWDQREAVSRQIEKRIEAELVAVHGAEWMARWQEGLPLWSDVPGEVNVFEILRLWTYGVGLDQINWAKMRYNLLGQGDHWFPGRNAADLDEAALRPLLAASPFQHQIPDLLRAAHARFLEAPVERASAGD